MRILPSIAFIALFTSGPQLLAVTKRMAAGYFTAYLSALKTAPLLTKAITGGVTALLGDVVAQMIARVCGTSSRWNFSSNLRFFLFGFVIHGPQMHLTYKYLIPQVTLGASLLTNSVVQCAVLQGLSTPSVLINFFLFMGLLTRTVPFAEMKAKLWPTYGKHLKYMTIPVLLSLLMPADLRAPYMSSCQIPWNAFLSYMKSCKPDQDIY